MMPEAYDSPITDEKIFSEQSDPMKVLPPKNNEIIGNEYGTVFMNAKTANRLLMLQTAKGETINTILELIDTKIRACVGNTAYIEEKEIPVYKALMELRADVLEMKKTDR